MRREICAAIGLWLGLALSANAQVAAGPSGMPGEAAGGGIDMADALASPMRKPKSALVRAASDAVPAAGSGRHPVVIELYTSQGCSSCPPADALMEELAERDDVIPLALHVDYWDYIGWSDRFADPAFTTRQKAYARAVGSRSIFTPQMIVNGQEHLVGVRPMELAELISRHAARTSPVTITLTRSEGKLRIDIAADPPLGEKAVVQLIRYSPSQTVSIERGENAGQTIRYTNIVTALEPIAEWDGAQPMSITATLAGPEPAVVIVQERGPGEIVAAARLR